MERSMHTQRALFASLVLSALVVLTSLFAAPASAATNVSLISLQSGHSVILQTPGVARIAVGDGRIAGVVPVGSSQVVINGKSPGHTTVFVWMPSGRATYEITVTEQEMDDLAQMLRTSIDDPNVQVVSFSHSIVVRGTVRDGAEYQSLSDILGRFDKTAGAQKYSIVNVVTVAHPLGSLQHD